jgi:hypothetical protein
MKSYHQKNGENRTTEKTERNKITTKLKWQQISKIKNSNDDDGRTKSDKNHKKEIQTICYVQQRIQATVDKWQARMGRGIH